MQPLIAGEEYLQAITARESDRRARTAFQQSVLQIAAPGACIFDFGAGPGIDAKFYAQRGFKVVAYDVDPRMCSAFEQYCSAEIGSNRVHLLQGDYRSLLASTASLKAHDIGLITANFAPLNLIDDLHELFRSLHACLAPDGKILASVLSPYFIGDMQYRWWWRHRPEFWRRGHFAIKGAQANVSRRSPANFADAAAPYFKLESVIRGVPGVKAHPVGRFHRAPLRTSRYMFLLFARR
jgi:SAM-dependent methyltransferase